MEQRRGSGKSDDGRKIPETKGWGEKGAQQHVTWAKNSSSGKKSGEGGPT